MSSVVSLCFDDGFQGSAQTIRRLFESRGLAACFALLAQPSLAADPYVRASPIADWGYWREAIAAGHEIGVHGHAHENYNALGEAEVRDSVVRAEEEFMRQLPGFRAANSVFHVPYLAAPAPIVEWLQARYLGVRLRTPSSGWNALGDIARGGIISCMTFGPPDPGTAIAKRLEDFLGGPEGWLVLVLHGLDGEGWGSVSPATLEALLDRIAETGLAVRPPGSVVNAYLDRTSTSNAPSSSAVTHSN